MSPRGVPVYGRGNASRVDGSRGAQRAHSGGELAVAALPVLVPLETEVVA